MGSGVDKTGRIRGAALSSHDKKVMEEVRKKAEVKLSHGFVPRSEGEARLTSKSQSGIERVNMHMHEYISTKAQNRTLACASSQP